MKKIRLDDNFDIISSVEQDEYVPEVPKVFEKFIVAVSDADGFLLLDCPQEHFDALAYVTGDESLMYLEMVVPEAIGVYELSFTFWASGPDHNGEYDAGLDLVECKILWQK